MARGQRKTIEEKISEKENLIESLKIRLKSEQRELEELHKEKREVDMKALHEVLEGEHNGSGCSGYYKRIFTGKRRLCRRK